MVWYNPRTWGSSAPTVKILPVATQTTPSGEVITARENPQGVVSVTSTTGATKNVSVKTSSGGGGTHQVQPVDASFTSGGSATGQGGTTFNSATNSGEVNTAQSKTYNPQTGTWSNNAPYTGSTPSAIQNKFYSDVKMDYLNPNPRPNQRGTRTDLSPMMDFGAGNKPTIEDVKPKTFFGTIFEPWKIAWAMTPYGISG
jgi:hypothetical protein